MQTSSAVTEYKNPSVYQVPPGSLNAKDNPNPGPMGGSNFSDVLAYQMEQPASAAPKPPSIPGLTTSSGTQSPVYSSTLPSNYSQTTRSFLNVAPGTVSTQSMESNTLAAVTCQGNCGNTNAQAAATNAPPDRIYSQRSNPELKNLPEYRKHALENRRVIASVGGERIEGLVTRVLDYNGVAYAEINDGNEDNLKYVPVTSITHFVYAPDCPDKGKLLVAGKGFIKLSDDMTMQLGYWYFSKSLWQWVYEAFAEPIMIVQPAEDLLGSSVVTPGTGDDMRQSHGAQHGGGRRGLSGRGDESAVDGSRNDRTQTRETGRRDEGARGEGIRGEGTRGEGARGSEPGSNGTGAVTNTPAADNNDAGRVRGKSDEERGGGRKDDGHRSTGEVRNKTSEDKGGREVKQASGDDTGSAKQEVTEAAAESSESEE